MQNVTSYISNNYIENNSNINYLLSLVNKLLFNLKFVIYFNEVFTSNSSPDVQLVILHPDTHMYSEIYTELFCQLCV